MRTVEELYEEWQDTEKAISIRTETLSAFDCTKLTTMETLAETLPFIKAVNDERETAFISGFELAMKEAVKYLEELPDKQDTEQAD